jgi:hypothetical protein
LLYQTLTKQSTVVSQQDYTITVPANMTLAKVMKVMLEDVELPPNSVETINAGTALVGAVGSSTPQTNTPRVYFQKTPTDSTISVYPLPSVVSTNGLVIRAAFAPQRAAQVLPDDMLENWAETVAAGALAILLEMTGQPFTSAEKSTMYQKYFDSGVRAASIYARSGRVVASSRVRMASFV